MRILGGVWLERKDPDYLPGSFFSGGGELLRGSLVSIMYTYRDNSS